MPYLLFSYYICQTVVLGNRNWMVLPLFVNVFLFGWFLLYLINWYSYSNSSIYKFGLSVCLFVCLFVCLYPVNVKTAEPIEPKFFVGHLVTPGKVYEWSKFQIFVSIKIRSSLNFWKFTKFFVKIRELFLFCFTMYTKRTRSQLI